MPDAGTHAPAGAGDGPSPARRFAQARADRDAAWDRGWRLGPDLPLAARRAVLAALALHSRVPRRVILAGPAGHIVIEAGHGRVHRVRIVPADGVPEVFGSGRDAGSLPATCGFGTAFDRALGQVLAAGALDIRVAPETGPCPADGGVPARRLLFAPATADRDFLP